MPPLRATKFFQRISCCTFRPLLLLLILWSFYFIFFVFCCVCCWKHFFNFFAFLSFELESWLQTTPTLGDVYARQDFRTLANDLTLVRELRPTFSCWLARLRKKDSKKVKLKLNWFFSFSFFISFPLEQVKREKDEQNSYISGRVKPKQKQHTQRSKATLSHGNNNLLFQLYFQFAPTNKKSAKMQKGSQL